MGVDVVNEPFLVFVHFEEIVGFLNGFRRGSVIRTFPLNQFPFLVKTLASKAVEAFITCEINIQIGRAHV